MAFETQWLTTNRHLFVQHQQDLHFVGLEQGFRTERLGESVSLE